MPTRRATPAADEIDDARELAMTPASSGAVYDPDDDDPLSRVRAALADMAGSECKTKVYRLVGGEAEWLFDTTWSEWEESGMNNLRATYGPGKYQLRVYGPAGLMPGGRPTFRIGAAMNAPAAPLATPAAPAVSPELASALNTIAQGQVAMMEMLRGVLTKPVEAPPDPMAKIRELQAMAELMRAMQPPPPAPAPSSDPMAILNQVLGTVTRVREVARDLNPPDEPESPMAALAMQGLDLVKTLATARGGAQSPDALPLPDDGFATDDETQPETGPETNTQILILRGNLMRLCQMEKDGATAAQGAEFLLSKLPEEMTDYLNLPNWFELLCTVAPAVKAHQAWLTQVHAIAVSRLKSSG